LWDGTVAEQDKAGPGTKDSKIRLVLT